jgi:hypothetical protein
VASTQLPPGGAVFSTSVIRQARKRSERKELRAPYRTQRPSGGSQRDPTGQRRGSSTTIGRPGLTTTTPGTTTAASPLGRHPPAGPRWKPSPHPSATKITPGTPYSEESAGDAGKARTSNDTNDSKRAAVTEILLYIIDPLG